MTCNDCGATVTRSDRFCPACGTPNAQCKFHPKFGPELTMFTPEVLDHAAAEGEPACPRCRGGITPPDQYCRACGMELGRAWHGYAYRRVIEQHRNPRQPVPYRSVEGVGSVVRVMCSGVAILGTLFGLGQLWRLARLEQVLTGGPVDADLVLALDGLGFVGLVALGISAVTFSCWARRAADNLPALAIADDGVHRHLRTVAWLIPGLNIYRPKQILDDLWRSGDRDIPPFAPSWRRAPVPLWSMVAWTAFVAAVIIGATSRAVSADAVVASGPAGSVTFDVAVAAVMAAVAGLFVAVSAFLVQDLVQRIAERQDERLGVLRAIEDPPERDPEPVHRADRTAVTALVRPPKDCQVVWGRY